MPKNEIAVQSAEDAMKIAEILTNYNNDYCVMISREENLWVVSYLWSPYSDRNNVVFMSREEFEDKYVEVEEENVGT